MAVQGETTAIFYRERIMAVYAVDLRRRGTRHMVGIAFWLMVKSTITVTVGACSAELIQFAMHMVANRTGDTLADIF
jgi:hypothetical protein